MILSDLYARWFNNNEDAQRDAFHIPFCFLVQLRASSLHHLVTRS